MQVETCLWRHLFGFWLTLVSITVPTTSALAQPLQIDTPGNAFSLFRSKAKIDDMRDGRHVRGEPGAAVVLQGKLTFPNPPSGRFMIQQLVVHFVTSRAGPSLRLVELWDSSHAMVNFQTNLQGDFRSRDTLKPPEIANAWTFGPYGPFTASAGLSVRLEVQFPTGFDSKINPGEFVLTSVRAGFVPK